MAFVIAAIWGEVRTPGGSALACSEPPGDSCGTSHATCVPQSEHTQSSPVSCQPPLGPVPAAQGQEGGLDGLWQPRGL